MITDNDVIIISADAEWQIVKKKFPDASYNKSPFGEWFTNQYIDSSLIKQQVIFLHGGWGKVAAAGSTQDVIDQWHPKMIINLGTCGGFAGKTRIGDVILADRTIIYDIYEQMGDPEQHVQFYSTLIDTSWLPDSLPIPVIRTLLVSGDRDLFCDEIKSLNEKYGAIAGDWESGAIAWIAKKNNTQCVILRGVTDLVSEKAGEAYDGNLHRFYENTEKIMGTLIDSLPKWLSIFTSYRLEL